MEHNDYLLSIGDKCTCEDCLADASDTLSRIISSNEAAAILGISASHATLLCRTGKIESKKIGKTHVCDKTQLKREEGQPPSEALANILSSEEAAKLWGYSPGYVKDLCNKSVKAMKENRPQDVVVRCKKIGRTWVIDKDTPNPAARKGD